MCVGVEKKKEGGKEEEKKGKQRVTSNVTNTKWIRVKSIIRTSPIVLDHFSVALSVLR